MLLGPSKHTHIREKVRKELKKKGYKKIILMEDIKNKDDEWLDVKFKRIIETHKPEIFVAFFHKHTKMNAVIFEIGWICGYYGPDKVGKKIRFLHEENFNLPNSTAYIESLLPRTTSMWFNESLKFRKASSLIHTFVTVLLGKP